MSDPSAWSKPPVDPSWWETIRETLPAFDVDRTPTRKRGAITECFRSQPGVQRSNHPQVSFAAWGAQADRVVNDHSLEQSLGERSPLARIYDLHGSILIGVGYHACTSMHLAENRADYSAKANKERGAPVRRNGHRAWVTFQDLDYQDDDFDSIGQAFEREGPAIACGRIGYADSRLMP